ncbi:MAG: DUF1028 domain-containing protein [Betaproteobacteria bacterium]
MTWSIIVRDASGAFGVAVASRFFGVGVLCPHVRSFAGALCTQALVNPLYGPRGLDLLAQDVPADEVVMRLVQEDAGRDHRQLHVIDRRGGIAAHTGSACIEWCGHTSGADYSVAGNMLAGAGVIAATASAYCANRARSLPERLLAALEAGEEAGGDKRGKQAAALRICTVEDYPALDLRVDDSEEPLRELRRLYDKSLERFQPFLSCLPSRARPVGITDRAQIELEVARFQAARAEGAPGK